MNKQDDPKEHTHHEHECECGGDCGCSAGDNEIWEGEPTQAENYALLGEEAYEELIKEKLKKKFLENEADLDKVAEIAFRCTMQHWQEMQSGQYNEEKWQKLDQELTDIWSK